MFNNGEDQGAIGPKDMKMLQTVLDQLLKEEHIAPTDTRAKALVSRVIAIFRSGIRDPETLKAMAR